MGSEEHRPRPSPGSEGQTSPRYARSLEEKLRERRAALLVKAVATKPPKQLQEYFVAALAAHELDTLNLLTKEL